MQDDAMQILRENGLRVTAPRLAVLGILLKAKSPMSHTEVLDTLGDTAWDQATVYRNLVKLTEAGVTVVASRADGIARYGLNGPKNDGHRHPHFVCEDCGQVTCLPPIETPQIKSNSRWAASVEAAMVQLRGECPDCLHNPKTAPKP